MERVIHPELLALTGDRESAARLERIFQENADRLVDAVRTGDLSGLSPAERLQLKGYFDGK